MAENALSGDAGRIDNKIKRAAEIVKAGGLVVYPTDTIYGLGADPFNRGAVMRIFEAKGRDAGKPISIAVANIEQARQVAEWNASAEALAKRFLPGPLTIILKKRTKLPNEFPANFPSELTCGKDSIGVRIVDHPVALELIELVGGPITATSANISGQSEPRTADDAVRQIGDKVDFVLDAGECPIGKPSTVVDLTGERGKPKIIREGAITKGEIEEVLSFKVED